MGGMRQNPAQERFIILSGIYRVFFLGYYKEKGALFSKAGTNPAPFGRRDSCTEIIILKVIPMPTINDFDSEQPQSNETVETNNATKMVLLVEDDQFLRDLMMTKLEDEHFRVEIAIEGNEALKKVKELKPDIILLDLMLPGMDGFEIMEKIQQDPDIAGIPVIVLSNLGASQDTERAKELGAVDYMIKAQFTPSEIVAKIKEVLGGSPAEPAPPLTFLP